MNSKNSTFRLSYSIEKLQQKSLMSYYLFCKECILCIVLVSNLSTYVKKLLGTQYFQFVDYFFYLFKSFFYIFKGITHAAVWAACCSFIAHNTDAELRPSAQSFIQGLHHGFGKFCGAVFGGMLVQKLGTIMVFRIYGGC